MMVVLAQLHTDWDCSQYSNSTSDAWSIVQRLQSTIDKGLVSRSCLCIASGSSSGGPSEATVASAALQAHAHRTEGASTPDRRTLFPLPGARRVERLSERAELGVKAVARYNGIRAEEVVQ